MNREMVIGRLEMLVSLIEETEILHNPSVTLKDTPVSEEGSIYMHDLFDEHLIKAAEDIQFLRDLIKKNKTIDDDVERMFMISTMRGANRLWKLHKKLLSGEFNSVEAIELETQVTTFLDDCSVISAIKYYREWMNEHGTGVTLREAKDKIDLYNIARKTVSLI